MKKSDQLEPQENLSGMVLLQQIVDGDRPHPSIADVINMRFEVIEKGRVVFSAVADERHVNPMDGTHGGFCATLLDSVTGCAVHSMLEAGVAFGTIELSVKMMRPVPRGKRLIAEGKLINISRSLGVSEGTVRDEDNKLYAHGTSTCMLIRSSN